MQYLDAGEGDRGAQALARRPASSTIPGRSPRGSTRMPGVQRGGGGPAAARARWWSSWSRRRRWRSPAAATGSPCWTRGAGCCPSIRSRSAPDLPLAANGDAVVTGVLARVRDSDPDLFARHRGGLAGAGRTWCSRSEGGASGSAPGFRGGHSSGDGGGAGARPERAGIPGARRALRRPGDRPPDARMSAQPQRLVAALDLGSTKVVAADRGGDRRRAGRRRPDSRRRDVEQHRGASAAASCGTSRRPPAPSTRR